uniref:Putative tick til 1 n=1 Tax=Amblyomma triste TaxID=251400 RepID=A0A023GCV3_AMBTT
MKKTAPACILGLSILCAIVLQTKGQSGVQRPRTSGVDTNLPNYAWFPNPGSRWRPRCGRNQVYLRCQSSSCGEQKCSDLFNRPYWPPICTADCVNRCFCKPGFFRDHRRRCVTWKKCLRGMAVPFPAPNYASTSRSE